MLKQFIVSTLCASNTISHVYKQIFAGIASSSIQFCCNLVSGFFYSSFFLLLAQNSSILLTKSNSHLLCFVLQLVNSFFLTKQKKTSFFFLPVFTKLWASSYFSKVFKKHLVRFCKKKKNNRIMGQQKISALKTVPQNMSYCAVFVKLSR